MTSSTSKSTYMLGLVRALPFVIVVIPFAMLFGVVATEAGLPLSQTMAFSVLVVAGASQFAALQFMSENAPVLVILASALAVNLRMAMYSASITPHLGAAPMWQRPKLRHVERGIRGAACHDPAREAGLFCGGVDADLPALVRVFLPWSGVGGSHSA